MSAHMHTMHLKRIRSRAWLAEKFYRKPRGTSMRLWSFRMASMICWRAILVPGRGTRDLVGVPTLKDGNGRR